VEDHRAADNPTPAEHTMLANPGAEPGLAFAMDRISMNIHGNADSHLDALEHVSFDGERYNGLTGGRVEQLSVNEAANGIVGRGVLIDVPRVRGVPWLEPGDFVTVDDVRAAERDQGVTVGRGDLMLVRVGHRERREQRGPWDAHETRAGLHPAVMPLLAERQIAVLGSDSNNDTAPSLVDSVVFPVHVLAIETLGLMLMDYLDLGPLAEACADAGRWSFLCVIAPLRLPVATGSPVNPIAVL
jgi:kynurenine formamidase